jgi:histidine triad (HIT) family protein
MADLAGTFINNFLWLLRLKASDPGGEPMDCVFCRIIQKEIPCDAVLETEDILAFRDIRPAAPVHILIVPKRHISTVNDLEGEDGALVARMIDTARDLARKESIAASGYRLVINCNREGGQEVFHIHLHLLGGCALGGMVQRGEGT